MAQPLALPRPATVASTSIAQASIHPLPLAAILDHHLRRPEAQDRVFGTLLGLRNAETGEIEVRSSFGVPYVLSGRDVAVDSDHHRSLLELHHRVSPKEIVVGWYATSPLLNSFSALLQDFYNAECAPSPALHLTLDPETLAFATYTSSPIGLSSSSLSLLFKPVPCTLAVPAAERTGLELLAQPLLGNPAVPAGIDGSSTAPGAQGAVAGALDAPISIEQPIAHLHALLLRLRNMVQQVSAYVDDVVEGKKEGDVQVGKYLLDSMGAVPASKNGAAFEEDFQAHLSDVLMVSYVANLVRTQAEISGRLNLLVS